MAYSSIIAHCFTYANGAVITAYQGINAQCHIKKAKESSWDGSTLLLFSQPLIVLMLKRHQMWCRFRRMKYFRRPFLGQYSTFKISNLSDRLRRWRRHRHLYIAFHIYYARHRFADAGRVMRLIFVDDYWAAGRIAGASLADDKVCRHSSA